MRLQGDKSLWDLTGCHIPRLRVLAAPLPSRALLYRLLMLFPEQALCPLQFTRLPFYNSSVHLTWAFVSFGCHICISLRRQLNTLMGVFSVYKYRHHIFNGHMINSKLLRLSWWADHTLGSIRAKPCYRGSWQKKFTSCWIPFSLFLEIDSRATKSD